MWDNHVPAYSKAEAPVQLEYRGSRKADTIPVCAAAPRLTIIYDAWKLGVASLITSRNVSEVWCLVFTPSRTGSCKRDSTHITYNSTSEHNHPRPTCTRGRFQKSSRNMRFYSW